jgi:biotin operon repressor
LLRVAGVGLDKIAEQFGVSRDAVWRHMSKERSR